MKHIGALALALGMALASNGAHAQALQPVGGGRHSPFGWNFGAHQVAAQTLEIQENRVR